MAPPPTACRGSATAKFMTVRLYAAYSFVPFAVNSMYSMSRAASVERNFLRLIQTTRRLASTSRSNTWKTYSALTLRASTLERSRTARFSDASKRVDARQRA
jgi:hypothetical protein